MYLKSIEIQGFKSFANKLLFEFHNGITGIVGPNGSGKSNVADAVRWVLGEQRIKQLRGASMQDVIFSGTELRKPQGFAYVAITLDNSDHQLAIDYGQVTVSRRLYRSGESEYMINGSPCRLKDINELFYDTGIGKEGYSIIGQGQIDKILSGRPEERRELFDEAAGIVKFKRRKAIAQKKLEDEQANLVRVRDILSELEKQVGPLERQSKAAREYLHLKDSLKICDANQFLLETEAIQKQLEETKKRQKLLSGDLEESQKEALRLKAVYDQLDQKLTDLEQTISSDREEMNQKTMETGSLEGQVNVLKEQIHTEERNEEHLKHRKDAILKDLEDKENQLSSYRETSASMEDQVKAALSRQEEAGLLLKEQENLILGLEKELEAAKERVIQTLNEKASLTAQKQRYDTMLEQLVLRKSEATQRLLRYKSEESQQDELLEKEQSLLLEAKSQLEQKRLAMKEIKEHLIRGEEEIRRLNRGLNNAQQEYHMSYTKQESLKNLAERYDGYGGSIRRVMETKDRIHGIHGVVADLISTQKQYETAIETALGGTIQNIVTDSETTAKQLIEYLKKNKYGRATFLPLTSINRGSSFSRPEALKEQGVLGLASSLVQADRQYDSLISYLLGRVAVVDTIDHAIALAKKFQYSFRIVTLEGELLSVGGSMTGGAFKNSSNLLGRRREIEELEQACQKALAAVESIQKELAMQEQLADTRKEEQEKAQGEIQQLILKENTLGMNISQLEKKKQEIQLSSADLVREHSQLEEQVRQMRDSQKTLAENTEHLQEQGKLADQEIEETSGLLEEAKLVRETYGADLANLQMESASLYQKRDFIKENTDRINREMEILREELSALSQDSSGSKLVMQAKKAEIERIAEQIEEGLKRAGELKTVIEHHLSEKEELAKEQKGFFAAREELGNRISSLDKDIFRVQAQKERLEEQLEAGASYMWSEYELTYSAASQYRQEEYKSLGAVKKQIEILKASIKGLGNINVNAIEDYREVSERYEFMKNQHEDLTNAQAELEKIIEELDLGMRRQFQERFYHICAQFDKVFKELFGGGRGTLELMEGEDVLEAGIQIIAQPPGKKLQNMMQLSGGEKALTAISLLFAIQNLKPSPFCLLDEIEAALDDSNVDRFAAYLHKLTANTQFIVITHRRGTMVSADRLYGITMQEKGVSTLVSVNLIEDELDQ